MRPITIQSDIAAPVDKVFDAITVIEDLPKVNPKVVAVEFLGETKEGLGTRFREIRSFRGKEQITDLEITEFEQDRRARMVADSHGTIWDSVFALAETQNGTRLTLTMEARTQKFLSKIMNFIFRPLFKRGMADHVDTLKSYCEIGEE